MSDWTIRPAEERDREAIRAVETAAFGGMGEAMLVDSLVAANDVILELVAERDGGIIGHVLFSRIFVDAYGGRFSGVARDERLHVQLRAL